MPSIGKVDKKFISAFALLDRPEILTSIIDIQNDQDLCDILGIAGRYKVTKQGTYHHYVNEALYKLLDTTGASVTGSGTATVGTATNAATAGIARKNELVKFPNGKVGIITAITYSTTDTITIKSVDGTNLTHTAAQKLSCFSNVVGEASKSPDAKRYGLTKYLNKLQIFREKHTSTDVQNASTVEVAFRGENYIIYKDLFEKAIKHKADVNAALVGGVMSNLSWTDTSPAFTDPINGGNLQTTGGMDWYIGTYGVADTVATPGTVLLTDMEDFNSQMLAVKAPRTLMQFVSNSVGTKFDNMVKALGSSGGYQSANFNIDGRTVNFTTDSFTYGNFTYEKIYLPILNHPDIFSQTDMVKAAYYVPKDKVKVHGGGYEPRMQVRYFKNQVKNNMGSEIWSEWADGALAPGGPIGDEAVWNQYFMSIQGLEMVGAQHTAKQIVLP